MVVALCSCGEIDDDATSHISNNEFSADLAGDMPANAVIRVEIYIDYSDAYCQVGSGSYSDGKLTLKLDKNIDEEYLMEFDDYPSMMVTNKKARAAFPTVYVYDRRLGEYIGYLNYETEDERWTGELIYVDSNVNIIGSERENDGGIDKYSVYLKKGWNFSYKKDDHNDDLEEWTTRSPGDMKWYYYSFPF
jgi:hypothetical protein